MAQQALDAVVSQLRPGTDEVGLFTFDSALQEREFFTRDLAVLQGALSEFEPFGTTSLYDAAAETARSVAARSATHKAIVVLTDGVDTSSAMSPSAVSALASSIDVPVYVVATVSPVDQRATLGEGERRSDSADLRHLAEWTGGRLLFADTSPEAIVAASSIIDEIRHQYLLAIEASRRQGVAEARCARQTPLGRREGAQRVFRRLMRRTRIRSVCRVWMQKTHAAPRRGSSSG